MSPHAIPGRFQECRYESGRGTSYPYGLYVPGDPTPGQKRPLILFLHGIGECGGDGQRHLKSGLPAAVLREPDRWPFVVLAPQKPAQDEEWEEHAEALFELLDRVIGECSVDLDRVHVTGLSQGGHGAWAMGAEQPERWASIVPICGYAAAPTGGWATIDPDLAWTAAREQKSIDRIARAVEAVPVWAFHGSADRIVPVDLTLALIDSLRARGANCRATIYEGVDHNAWDRAYADAALTEFLTRTHRTAD